MPVLIDGNNLLYAARDTDPERPPSRSTLCLRLGQWARRTGERVSVIFDGPAPTGGLARQISDPDVAVSYSGTGVSADAVLAETIEADTAARLLLVVSSDREVLDVARRRQARGMRSDEFWAMVLGALARPERPPLEPDEKRQGLPAADTERWLRELGLPGSRPGAEDEGD
jgi:predicted RNA-binding protein with PIN domain